MLLSALSIGSLHLRRMKRKVAIMPFSFDLPLVYGHPIKMNKSWILVDANFWTQQFDCENVYKGFVKMYEKNLKRQKELQKYLPSCNGP